MPTTVPRINVTTMPMNDTFRVFNAPTNSARAYVSADE